MNSLYAFEVLEQALAALETSDQSILNTNNQIVQNLVDASRGRVTSSLFPFQDLRKVLHVGEYDHKLIPLFDLPLLHHYYPLLTSIITLDAIVIHVPFQSGHVYEFYRLEHFPFLVNGLTLSVDLPAFVVLLSMETFQYAVLQTYRLAKKCVIHFSLYGISVCLFAIV